MKTQFRNEGVLVGSSEGWLHSHRYGSLTEWGCGGVWEPAVLSDMAPSTETVPAGKEMQ